MNDHQSLATYLANEAITITKIKKVSRSGQADKWWGYAPVDDITGVTMKARIVLYSEDIAAIKAQGYDMARWEDDRMYNDQREIDLFPWESPTVIVHPTKTHGWRIKDVRCLHNATWRAVREIVAPTLTTITEIDLDTLCAGDVLRDKQGHEYELVERQGAAWKAKNLDPKMAEFVAMGMLDYLEAYRLRQMTIVKRAEMRVSVMDTRYLLPARSRDWWVTPEIARRWDYIGCAAYYKRNWLAYAAHSSTLMTFNSRGMARENMRNAWNAMALWVWDARGDCWYPDDDSYLEKPSWLEQWYYRYAMWWMLRAVVSWFEMQMVIAALNTQPEAA